MHACIRRRSNARSPLKSLQRIPPHLTSLSTRWLSVSALHGADVKQSDKTGGRASSAKSAFPHPEAWHRNHLRQTHGIKRCRRHLMKPISHFLRVRGATVRELIRRIPQLLEVDKIKGLSSSGGKIES